MKLRLGVGSDKVYDGEYDILAMAAALGIEDSGCPVNLKPEGGIQVTVVPEGGEETVAITKMVNYAHATLNSQGVITPLDYRALREELVKGNIGSDTKLDFSFTFTCTDEALFFASVMRLVDLHFRPKWQIWLTEDDNIEVPDGVKVKVFSESHFMEHYFHRVTKQNIPSLTHTKAGSPAYKLLDTIRTRLGKGTGLIKTTRVRMSDEDKLVRAISRISDEDRELAPAAFEDLKNGTITMKQFRTSVWSMKRSKRTSARASAKTARRVITGTKASVVRTLNPGVQSRIDNIKKTIEERRKQDSE